MDKLERIWVRRDGQSRDTGCTDQLQDTGRASDEADQCVHTYFSKHNIVYHYKHLTYYKLHSDQCNNIVAKQAAWLPTTCGKSMLDSLSYNILRRVCSPPRTTPAPSCPSLLPSSSPFSPCPSQLPRTERRDLRSQYRRRRRLWYRQSGPPGRRVA